MLNKISAWSVELNWEVQHSYACEWIWVGSRQYKLWLHKFVILNFYCSCFINTITMKYLYDSSTETD